MSKELVLITPGTVPTLILWKLDALGSNPKKRDLNVIRELLEVDQEERVVSDEELQEWKKLEKKVLEAQNIYKKETKSIEKLVTYSSRFCKFFTLPVIILGAILENLIPTFFFKLFVSWPRNFMAVYIYLYHLYCSDTGVLQLLGFFKKSVKPLEDEDDDDWEDSMTSTELRSRQKVILNGWEQVKKERKRHLNSDFLPNLPRFINLLYFLIRFTVVSEGKSTSPVLQEYTESELYVEFYASLVFYIIFFAHFALEWIIRSDNRKQDDD